YCVYNGFAVDSGLAPVSCWQATVEYAKMGLVRCGLRRGNSQRCKRGLFCEGGAISAACGSFCCASRSFYRHEILWGRVIGMSKPRQPDNDRGEHASFYCGDRTAAWRLRCG